MGTAAPTFSTATQPKSWSGAGESSRQIQLLREFLWGQRKTENKRPKHCRERLEATLVTTVTPTWAEQATGNLGDLELRQEVGGWSPGRPPRGQVGRGATAWCSWAYVMAQTLMLGR